jgi:hypothetical protein
MATNSILTPTQITREALRILHGKLTFLGNVNRQYDDQFARSGAKIGTSLNIRMPPKYTVRTNATLAAQDHTERSTPLTVSSQYGVDVSFTSLELTMSLDDFSQRYIKPAMSQLAAKLEQTCLSAAYKLVPNYVNATTNAVMTYAYFQGAGQKLTEQLAPYGDRTALLTPYSKVQFLDATKALFHQSEQLEKQFRDGAMGRTGGFDVYESTHLPSHSNAATIASALTTGAALGTSTTTANTWASVTTLSVDTATSNGIISPGDIITISGVYDVHPETKQNTGKLKTFVVDETAAKTLTTAANTYTFNIRPAMIYGSGNAYQNCVLSGVSDTDNNTVTRIGAASSSFGQDLFFHKDAFVFATADLQDVSRDGAWGSRQTMDGISMRIARQYAIATDTFPCRIDVLFGFAGLYPELAARHMYELDLT